MSPEANDPFDLARFVIAQQANYHDAIAELRAGHKQTHWMWYVLPQAAGLGTSAMAMRYAIQSRKEAIAYLAHPVLGPRLRECVEALLAVEGKSAREVMGQPDDVKLHSSMTLFALISPAGSPFTKVLERYYAGTPDPRTIAFLAAQA